MRVLVCGGRFFEDATFIYRELNRLHKQYGFDVVIEGNAKGVDRIAGYWARRNDIDNLKFPPNWSQHGRAAGAKRNHQMLVEGKPDLVIAFPGGKGTADMVMRARRANIDIIEIIGDLKK